MRPISFALLACAGIYFLSCNTDTSNSSLTSEISNDSLVKKGHYLITILGCGDCHTPKLMTPRGPVPDTSRILSGYREGTPLGKVSREAFAQGWSLFNSELTAMASPMGISFSANLTSDETGIGTWTFEQFKTALTKGKWKGLENSRDLLPPMPWMNYVNMEESDMKALFAYLKSTKPIKNKVPDPIPADKME